MVDVKSHLWVSVGWGISHTGMLSLISMQGCPQSPDMGKLGNFALHSIVLILWRELFWQTEGVYRPPSLEVRSLEVTLLNSHLLSPPALLLLDRGAPGGFSELACDSFIPCFLKPYQLAVLFHSRLWLWWLMAHLILSSGIAQGLCSQLHLSMPFLTKPRHAGQDETSMKITQSFWHYKVDDPLMSKPVSPVLPLKGRRHIWVKHGFSHMHPSELSCIWKILFAVWKLWKPVRQLTKYYLSWCRAQPFSVDVCWGEKSLKHFFLKKRSGCLVQLWVEYLQITWYYCRVFRTPGCQDVICSLLHPGWFVIPRT